MWIVRFLRPASRRAAGWAALAILASGCGGGDGLERASVTGKVTLDGKPLERGAIQFIPTGGDSRGAAWGEIAAGSYTIPAADGPAPGAYDVAIAPDVEEGGAAPADPPALPGDPPPDAIDGPSVTYTPSAPLKADVAASGPNTFDFDLTTTAMRRKPRRR